jgi:hypothetical protein
VSEQIVDDVEDLGQPAANGELVHWMEPRRLRVGPAGVSMTAAGAFTLGLVTAVAVLALAHWLGPERTMTARRRAA